MPNIKVLQTIRTSCGCVAQGFLASDLTWDADPVGTVTHATYARIDLDSLSVLELCDVDGDAWIDAEETGAIEDLTARMQAGQLLQAVWQHYLPD